MAKSAVERKAVQRANQKRMGIIKIELLIESMELEILKKNCVLRRLGREPYDMNEYIQLLILKDNNELQEKMHRLESERCDRCNKQLPVKECCLAGDSKCWVTLGWHEVKLKIK
ncbi:hypothetical protein [Providencia burhodogranariea]|uniref:Bacteriophage protein gp46 n=1 Tax=Providencia burhodogranariea DSM 19968 TaxID=1141662 RepID=K8X589_9GAMM|nr:hypothetical protein [Providencia burhodogranariea]EKT63630.1 hypothetical protein OOA_04627 [Providencia burhodogranariea DSM 19968]